MGSGEVWFNNGAVWGKISNKCPYILRVNYRLLVNIDIALRITCIKPRYMLKIKDTQEEGRVKWIAIPSTGGLIDYKEALHHQNYVTRRN